MSATVDRATVIANALAKLAVNPVALDADNPGDPRAARILRLYDNHLR